MTMDEFWQDRAIRLLQGRTIDKVTYITKEEANKRKWASRGLILTLSDGAEVTILSDDEGSNSGSVFYYMDEENLGVIPTI